MSTGQQHVAGDDLDELWASGERRRRARQDRRRRGEPDGPRGDLAALWASGGGRALIVLCLLVLLGTAGGLLAFWPGEVKSSGAGAFGGPSRGAEVTASRIVPCSGQTAQRCRQIEVDVDGRPEKLTLGPVGGLTPSPQPGSAVRVTPVPEFAGVPSPEERFAYAGVDRRGGLAWLGLLLAVVALVTLRLRGALAALGVVGSVGLVVAFLIPAMLEGSPAVPVALSCALAVTVITVGLTHGLAAPSLAALLGVTVTLLLSAGLAEVAVRLVALDGRSNEIAGFLAQQQADVSLRGIVLAGMLIGALGVLADTAVTQSSAVVALRRANPGLSARRLYAGAITVGRDHLAATIHTLVLAYVGTALPLLLVLRSSGVGATDALNAQDVAEPIAATIIGCLALIAAVPLTTGLAAYLVARTPANALGDGDHGHVH
ncbi:MAG: YibE/F family protein [Solirubrobacterales bacterium]|nr:YibE/F family protein [Solirubrobacterales bacterium]